jgi:endo-1,4-beta-xylanase
MAWAWGFSRAVDAVSSLPSIRRDALAVTGHSRFGKAALVAGAFDERIALTVPASSGLGGVGNYRFFFETQGKNEKIENIVGRFPYWFTPVFREFVGNTARLPFDQHSLMALVAPRALLVTVGTDDAWANPRGSELSYSAARRVYEYLGAGARIGIQIGRGPPPLARGYFAALLDFADAQLLGRARARRFDALTFPGTPAAMPWAKP